MTPLTRRRFLTLAGSAIAGGAWLAPGRARAADGPRVVRVADGRAWSGPGWSDANLDAAVLQEMIAQPHHQGRKASLLMTLGDCYRKQGRLDAALQAYRTAISIGVSAQEEKTLKNKIEDCLQTSEKKSEADKGIRKPTP